MKLRIIGNGDLEYECRKLVQNLDIENAVTFLGAQPSDIVLHEMRQASVFVQHSLTPKSGDKEGWPVSVAEAASLGLPIISTNHASIPEQVIHHKTGLLGRETDWMQMSEYMSELANLPETRYQFGRAARSHICQWTASQQIGKLAEILERYSQ